MWPSVSSLHGCLRSPFRTTDGHLRLCIYEPKHRASVFSHSHATDMSNMTTTVLSSDGIVMLHDMGHRTAVALTAHITVAVGTCMKLHLINIAVYNG